MPIASPRPADLAATVAALTAACRQAGYEVSRQRPIDYGVQLGVSDGAILVTVNVYGGRKGVRAVVNGTPDRPLYQAVNAILIRLPQLGAAAEAAVGGPTRPTATFPQGPWIGSDESGKGDYFGPLVAAAVYVSPAEEEGLRAAGVRDSKTLSDAAARQAAAAVRSTCAGRFAEWELPPVEYNECYERLRARKENLNHLLAGGHVRVLAALLAGGALPPGPLPTVIADQFADERHVRERLQRALAERGAPLPDLIQTPRAEANVAVAAASILARDRFLAWLEQASARYGIALPKGGSNPAIIAAANELVRRHGPGELRNAAKLHFVTTKAVGSNPRFDWNGSNERRGAC